MTRESSRHFARATGVSPLFGGREEGLIRRCVSSAPEKEEIFVPGDELAFMMRMKTREHSLPPSRSDCVLEEDQRPSAEKGGN